MPATMKLPQTSSVTGSLALVGSTLALGEDGKSKHSARKFAGKANSGQPIPHWWYGTLVLDMAGGIVNRKDLPVLLNHDPERVAGVTESITLSDDGIDVDGRLIETRQHGAEAVDMLEAGLPLQMSIWFQPHQARRLSEGKVMKVNGRDVAGPAYVVTKWTLREVTLTALGADEQTGANLLAGRSGGGAFVEVEELREEHEEDMTKPTNDRLSVSALAEQQPEAVSEIRLAARQQGTDDERARLKFALERAEKLGTPAAKVREAIEKGWDRERIAVEFSDELAARRTEDLGKLRSGGAESTGGSPRGSEPDDQEDEQLEIDERSGNALSAGGRDQVEVSARKEWDKDAKLRAEFRDRFELYLGMRRREARKAGARV